MPQPPHAAMPSTDIAPRVRSLTRAGSTVGYVEFGEGPVLIMLHACGTGAHTLRPLAARLSRGRRVICLDFDGYGDTAIQAAGGDCLHRHRLALRLLLEELAIKDFDLFGHSMGGFIALQAAADGSLRPRRMVLAEPTVFSVLDESIPQQAEAKALDRSVTADLIAAVEAGEPERGMAAFMALWNEAPWQTLPEALRQRLVALAPQVAGEADRVCRAIPPEQGFAAADCPILLLQGQHAPAPISALIPVLAGLLPSALRTLVPGTGHMGPLTSPDLFATLIGEFLNGALA